MPKFTVKETIDAPFDKVNDNFADTYVYHPFVEHSRSLNDQQRGVGARRECTMYNGQKVNETLREAREGHWVIGVSGMGPVKSMTVRTGAAPKGTNSTEASYDMDVRMKFPFQIMGPMVKTQMSGMMRKLVKGIEEHVNSGRLVEKGGKLGRPIAAGPAVA